MARFHTVPLVRYWNGPSAKSKRFNTSKLNTWSVASTFPNRESARDNTYPHSSLPVSSIEVESERCSTLRVSNIHIHGVPKTLQALPKPSAITLRLHPPKLPPLRRRARRPNRRDQALRRSPSRKIAGGGQSASASLSSSSPFRFVDSAQTRLGRRRRRRCCTGLRPRGQDLGGHGRLHCQQFEQWVCAYLRSRWSQVNWPALLSQGGRRILSRSS